MPKSRGRKNKGAKKSALGIVKMTPRVEDLMRKQLETFRKEFGRATAPASPP